MLRQAAFVLSISFGLLAPGQTHRGPTPQLRRHSPSDLELTTFDSFGVQRPKLFLSRSYLASLPSVSIPLNSDDNFPELPNTGAIVTGIDLDQLLKALAPAELSAALVAICRDGYNSPFPRSVVVERHPILVITIDGLTPHAWAIKHHTYDPGPYFVTYKNFVSSFHLLAHADFPQHPAEIVRLKIVPTEDLFRAIKPPVFDLTAQDTISIGFQIAQQNCFRCHNSGDTGGTKAQRSWQYLGQVAKTRPDYFGRWVHNPRSIDPKSTMYPNLQYDQPTLNALTRYFQTFAP